MSAKNSTSPSTSRKETSRTNTLLKVIGVGVFMSACMNILHVQQMENDTLSTTVHETLLDFTPNSNADNQQQSDSSMISYPDLRCEKYGGPNNVEHTREMVYWEDIPSDSHFVSPFKSKVSTTGRTLYMTFEPDGGGWNNIRMAMETILGLAIATGRVLVLPPEQRMYLLAKNRGKQKTDFSFQDFFPMKELATENDALHIITMEEFLQKEAMTGNLFDKFTHEVTFPPNNRTDWNGQDVKPLKEWLRNSTFTPLWDPFQCIAAFPSSGKHEDSIALTNMHKQIMKDGMLQNQFLDKPLPLDATPMERMKEMLGKRENLCLYDEQMQNEFVLHFMCYHKMHVRMLIHFYIFIYFENYVEDLWMKRFMRDHVRYTDEIQCAAARVVHAMRSYVIEQQQKELKHHRKHKNNKKDTNPNPNGDFITFHIRRGDFQYKSTRISAEEIIKNVHDQIPLGSYLYIATDEHDLDFFEPIRHKYNHTHVRFLNDFIPTVLSDVNHNYFGMIDQLVASRGKLFFGCYYSTFTGYIMRMRGYHSVKDKLPGHKDGLLYNSFYYAMKESKLIMHKYAPIQPNFFGREFPTSWRELDYGIDKLGGSPIENETDDYEMNYKED